MNQDIFETILLFLGSCWMFYKYNKTKSLRSLFVAILLILFLPSRWPLFLPIQFSFSLMAFCSACFIFSGNYEKNKKKDPLAYFYIILFLAFGLTCLGEVLFNWKLGS